VLANNRHTGLASRNTQARSRLKTVHTAFYSSSRKQQHGTSYGRAVQEGRKARRFLCSGTPILYVSAHPDWRREADSNRNTGVSHDW